MSLNQGQARHLAAFIATIRPDWDERGIYVALGRCRNQRAANVALAAIRCADDPHAETPGAIPNPEGPHWSERRGDPAAFSPPRREQECPVHAGQYAEHCRACAADRLAGETTTRPTQRSTRTSEHVAGLRARIRPKAEEADDE